MLSDLSGPLFTPQENTCQPDFRFFLGVVLLLLAFKFPLPLGGEKLCQLA